MRAIILFVFLFNSFFASTQVVEEVVTIDTNSITLNVIYKQDTEGYYFKKTAFFAEDTNQIAIEKTFTAYGQNGVCKVYYPSGRLMIFTVYANSKIHGDWTYYGEDGIIRIKGKYKEGVKHKFWAYKYDKSYGRYKDGFKNGRWTHTDVNDEKNVAHFQNGVLKYGEQNFFKEFGRKKKVKKDTVITEDGIQLSPLSEEYELVVNHLISNYLFRKRFKYFYSTKKKERVALDKHFNYKKDYFKFRLAPVQVPLDLITFTNELKEGKVANPVLDSVLRSETIKAIEQKNMTSNNYGMRVDRNLFEYSTVKDADVIIYLSKNENNIIKAEIFNCVLSDKELDYAKFYNNNSCKKMNVLYYVGKNGVLNLEYENDPNP